MEIEGKSQLVVTLDWDEAKALHAILDAAESLDDYDSPGMRDLYMRLHTELNPRIGG